MSSDARDIRGIHDDGFHEIHLSGKQLIFLFMATTVVSVVIFLCGVLVGRGARPVVPGEGASLVADASAADRAAADAEPGDPAADAASAGVKADGLTYYERLNQQQPAAERLDEPAPPDETPVETAPAPAPQNAAARNAAAQDTAKPRTTSPAATARAKPETPPPTPAPAKATAPAAGAWTVQVAALRQRGEADAIARRLTRKGFDAYVLAPSGRASRVYRVRVGHFASRDEADRMKNRLAREEQFKPWVTQ